MKNRALGLILLLFVELLFAIPVTKAWCGFVLEHDDVKLRKVGDLEPEKNTLPRGVFVMVMGDQVYFLKRMAGRFMPLPEPEQEILRRKHVS